MSEHCQEPLCCRPDDLHSALAIHTQKITDSCRDKDCIEDIRVYLTKESQQILETASSAKVRTADLIYTSVDVSPVGFHPNHYYIDLVFYYRIIADAMVGTCRPATLYGLAMFPKRAILCGEVAGAHIFTNDCFNPKICCNHMPRAVVEALDPMVLATRIGNGCGCGCSPDPHAMQIPDEVRNFFDEDLSTCDVHQKLYVTLGQFSIIRLERPAQLIVPVLDYSIPTKQCCDNPGCAETPCDLFARIPFPTDEFTPTGCDNEPDCGCNRNCDCNCNCDHPQNCGCDHACECNCDRPRERNCDRNCGCDRPS